jgi:hypothetical protein
MNFKGCGRYNPGIFLERLRRTMEIFTQNNQLQAVT